jgi:AraC-like DNA-binding protein
MLDTRDGSWLQTTGEPAQPIVICRPTSGPPQADSAAAGLFASSGGELARLARLLGHSACFAVIRWLDGTVLPVRTRDDARSSNSTEARHALSFPIHGSDGIPVAFMELTADTAEHSHLADTLLRATAESAARAISERWFRISHLNHWIVAAQPVDDPEKYVLLAVDRDRTLVGANHTSREILEKNGLTWRPGLPLSVFFLATSLVLNGGRDGDRYLRLPGADDAAPWSVLITPPDFGATRMEYDDRVQLHSRPRMDTIGSLNGTGTNSRDCGVLPPRVCRRVDEFIDARLEGKISNAELASHFGLSNSHFFRKFRKSFGMTPQTYIMRRRLSLAQDLLVKTDISMVDIALKAGFSDQSHFSRNFHRFIGLPPRVFRMQHS